MNPLFLNQLRQGLEELDLLSASVFPKKKPAPKKEKKPPSRLVQQVQEGLVEVPSALKAFFSFRR